MNRRSFLQTTILVIFVNRFGCCGTFATSELLYKSDRPGDQCNNILRDAAPVDDTEPRLLRLITYNVLYGGDGCGENRLHRLQRWFRHGSQDAACPPAPRYDFPAFNEANGWHRDLPRIADGFGFPHSALLEAKTGFHIAFMSRFPFDSIAHTDPPFHHGMLEVRDRQHNLALLLTHLTPRDPASRALEAAAVARRAAALDAAGVPVLVLGDLNTLSPLDAPAHARAGLAARLAAAPALARKFLTPGGAIDCAPMAAFLAAGLVDLAAPPKGAAAAEAKAGEACAGAAEAGATVPTACGEDAMHAAPMRLDYVLASARAAALAAGPARAVGGAETGRLSVHLPVECALRIPAPARP